MHYTKESIMAKAKLSIVNVDSSTLSAAANTVGAALGSLKNHETQVAALKDTINKLIAGLHTAKAKVGIYKKDGSGCAIATAFVDGCVEGGIAASTAQKVYLPTFKQAVASGKPVTDWNSKRANGKGKGKGAKASEPKSLANKLATCFRDEGFAEFIDGLQESFTNDEGNLIDLIKSYLEAEGIEFKDAE
jgi:hypothetical protein